MNFREKLHYKLLPLAVAFFFGMMLFGTIFKPGIRDGWMPLHIVNLFVIVSYGLLVLLIWTLIIKYIKRKYTEKPTKRAERRFLLLFFGGLIITQALFLSQINLPMNAQCMSITGTSTICVWDWNFIAQGAANAAGQQSSGLDTFTLDYLHVHQNNIPIFYLMKTIFQLAAVFGITNFQLVGVIFNVIMINLSLLLIYLTARRLFGARKAMFSLAISASILPVILMYTPIFYTDTLSLPFPIAMFYLYVVYRNAQDKRKAFWLIPAIALLAFLGAMIKFSVMIVLVAIVIDMIVHTSKTTWKRTVLSLGAMVAVIAPLLLLYANLAQTHIHDRSKTQLVTTPWTHYFMMGLGSSNGGQYSVDDDRATSTKPSVQAAIDYNLSEIKKRLADHGLTYPVFLYGKALATWTDGTYESLYRLGNTSLITTDYHPSAFQSFLTTHDSKYAASPISPMGLMNAVTMLLLVALFIGGIKTYVDSARQKPDRSRALLQLSIMGVAGFLLLWETNSRYLVNFLPLVIVATTPTLYTLAPSAIHRIKISYLAARQKLLKY